MCASRISLSERKPTPKKPTQSCLACAISSIVTSGCLFFGSGRHLFRCPSPFPKWRDVFARGPSSFLGIANRCFFGFDVHQPLVNCLRLLTSIAICPPLPSRGMPRPALNIKELLRSCDATKYAPAKEGAVELSRKTHASHSSLYMCPYSQKLMKTPRTTHSAQTPKQESPGLERSHRDSCTAQGVPHTKAIVHLVTSLAAD